MTKILATGDWHVGSGLDYGRTPGARLADQERAIECAVDLAIAHDVDVVALAGDIWHRRRPTPAEMMAVARPLRRLRAEHTCDIVAIAGNHCVETADGPIALELFEDIVDVYRHPGIVETRAGAFAMLPWTPLGQLIAARDGRDDVHELAARLLVETARDLRNRVDGACVLMLHWSVSEASTPTGMSTDTFSETVIPADELAALGFDAIVCSHIHKAQAFTTMRGWVAAERLDVAEGSPFFYTGSLLPVDFGEASTPHGVWLMGVDDAGADATFLPIASRPFVALDYDWRDAAVDRDVVAEDLQTEKVADAVVHVRYDVTEDDARRVDRAEIARALYDAGAHKVYSIRPVIERAARVRVDGMNEEIAPLAAVDAWVSANEISTEHSAALVDLTSHYLQEVGT